MRCEDMCTQEYVYASVYANARFVDIDTHGR